MKLTTIMAVCTCLSFAVVWADQAADEAAIREVGKNLTAAFNKHDAKGMAGFLADSYQGGWTGEHIGPEGFIEMVAEVFENQKNVQRNEIKDLGITFVTPDVAIHRFHRQYTGTDEPGTIEQARILVKQDGKWRSVTSFTRALEETSTTSQ